MVQEPITSTSPQKSGQRGQALVEYALILTLVVMALIAAVAATGPALGNVFSNTVYNLVGINGTPQDLTSRGGPVAFWMTVTYVATNPPQARVFPSPVKPPNTPTNTPGPSPTSPTSTPSNTPKPTATIPPTPTAQDSGYIVPYIDPIDEPVRWRVDNSFYLGGADWYGEYFNNTTLNGTPDQGLWNAQVDPSKRFVLDFNWGTASPLDGWATTNYSIRFTRTIYIQPGTVAVPLTFLLAADDWALLKIDGSTVIANATSGSSWTQSFTPNATLLTTHTIVVEYHQGTGNSSVSLGISSPKANVKADTTKPAGSTPNCPWTRVSGTQPNTISYAWKENLASVTNGFPINMTCNLELRGWVDLTGATNPKMSFWDVWDLGSNTDTSIKLQVAEYAPYNDDLSGGPNWGAGSTVTLHTTGTNYAWTRNEIDLTSLANKKVTWRFVMDSGGSTNVRRWYLDDIQVLSTPATPKNFYVCSVSKYTCGSFWDLDNTAQKADFITTGRWDLTNRNSASNDSGGPSMSWDAGFGANGDGNGKYVPFGSEQGSNNRIHYVAFNGFVNLNGIGSDGSGGTPDWEGDFGYPILSFYQASGLDAGDSIEVQYTRASDTAGTPAVWSRVGLNAIKTTATTDPMKKYELQLKDIPSWNSQPFRLRFALTVNNSAGSTGWFIDNIAIEREGVMKYSDYPFCDDAEATTDQWIMGAQWGIATTSGAFTTGRSFSDSPAGNYVNTQVSSMTLRYPVDLNNDTPENLTLYGGNHSCYDGSTAGGKAINPILNFWHWRKLVSSKSFRIELFRSAHTNVSPVPNTTAITPTNVWGYTYSAGNASQVGWEREELDLRAAVEKVTGLSWATLTTNTDKYDDDFYFQITFDASSGSNVSDGIYIDNITLQEYSESSFKLWATGTTYTAPTNAPVGGKGDGTDWLDNIDTPDDWYNRWTTGSTWTGVTWDAHSGITSMHDTGASGQQYLNNSFNVMEMSKILDLRGAVSTDLPTLYFWTHYNIAANDWVSVDVAVQDNTEYTATPPTRNLMGYDYQYRWGSATSYAGGSSVTSWGGASSWQSVWNAGMTTGLASRNDAWTRKQVDLRNFAGKRLKVRFVLNSLNSSSTSLGWWLDDIRFTFRTNNVIAVPFLDNATNMYNWVAEGKWGLAPDQWRGSGGGPAELGTNPWSVYWFDCIGWISSPTQTTSQASYLAQTTNCDTNVWKAFFDSTPLKARTQAATDAWIAARPTLVSGLHYAKDFTDVVNYDFGSDGRPSSADNTWYDYYAARMLRKITVTGGQYTFITTSDDGIRLGVFPVTTTVPTSFYNVINDWSYHGRTVDYQSVTLTAGDYQIIAEWFEGTGDAVVQIQVGTNKFSFSDSPKATAASTAVNSIANSDYSLLLNGVINLNIPAGYTAAQWKPRLDYYVLYDLASNSYGVVEVSTDGGFNWTTSGLTGTGTTCPVQLTSSQCDPYTNSGTFLDPAWYEKNHDLINFVGQNVGIRFHLHTSTSVKDGWWVTDIGVGNTG